jgi:hypothetical protein
MLINYVGFAYFAIVLVLFVCHRDEPTKKNLDFLWLGGSILIHVIMMVYNYICYVLASVLGSFLIHVNCDGIYVTFWHVYWVLLWLYSSKSNL